MRKSKIFSVCEEGVGRLDRFLKKNNPGVSYGVLMRFVRKKQVRVNGLRAYIDTQLKLGDTVTIYRLLVQKEAIARQKKPAIDVGDLCIYEDDDVWVCNKPQGLSVQGGCDIPYSLDSLLRDYSARKGIARIRLVHRIDRETTGLVLCAKNRDSAQIITQHFYEHNIIKWYDVLVHGCLATSGDIKTPLKRNSKIQEAHTLYEVLKSTQKATLLRVQPITGRKHQIRQHLASIGHSVVGDLAYGGKGEALCLHAGFLQVAHKYWEVEWPATFEKALQTYGFKQSVE